MCYKVGKLESLNKSRSLGTFFHGCSLCCSLNQFGSLSLVDLTFIAWIEMFMHNMYGYFNHSPKWHLDFWKLVQILDTKKNNIMENMKTKWMSILELLKRILMEYCPLFVMMELIPIPSKLQRFNWLILCILLAIHLIWNLQMF
jgi:hypothetical protein